MEGRRKEKNRGAGRRGRRNGEEGKKEEEGKVGEEGGGEEHGRMERRKKEEVKIEVLGAQELGVVLSLFTVLKTGCLQAFHTKQSSYLRQQSPRQQLVHFPPLSPGDVRGGGRGSSAGCPPAAGDSDETPRPQTASCGAAPWSCLH